MTLRRFDPRSGTWQDLGTVESDGDLILSAPTSEDWVFVAAPVPEPATLSVLVLGCGLCLHRRQRNISLASRRSQQR
jgi:hypothetical protein